MKRTAYVFLTAATVSQAVAASLPGHEVQTGEALVKMCSGAERVKMLGMMCHSYLNGYIDTATVFNKGGRFCLRPDDKQFLPSRVASWLRAHPDLLSRPAPEALNRFLPEYYPCPK
ncbi:hypothetical protein EZJ19_15655 [Parasulfuritortus cantonensis]|uniref:Rap1a immunity protein domain-containing protein n=1 Tax=Parasulfuritortus cantonensis TaxID=2528202 RepID=A0A4R1B159_9PROT|nr:Rap1a/Tai family immunity protein [Parasulfuritortus cantonensis]TCJ11501.1 hypothetical protein EZJ19_15655 [Parasulfuritortus cantonensis]